MVIKPNTKPNTKKRRPLIDPETPVLYLTEQDWLTIRELCSGLLCVGSSGSGKTEYVLRVFLSRLLELGCGGIATLTKADDLDFYKELVAKAGREDQLAIVNAECAFDFNFLKSAADNPESNDSESLTTMILMLVEIVQGSKRSTSEDYWENEVRKLTRASLNILKCAGTDITLQNLYKFVISSPQGRRELASESFRESYCFSVLDRAMTNTEKAFEEGTAQIHHEDLETSVDYITNVFCSLSDKTRSIVISVFGTAVEAYLNGTLRRIFSSQIKKASIPPEATRRGAIVVIDTPLLSMGEVGRIAGATYQYFFYQAMLRKPFDPYNDRYVFNICDEHSFYVNSFTERFQAVARSAGVVSFYLNQSVPSYHKALGDPSGIATDALFSNLATKIILSQSDPRTNQYFSEMIGKTWSWNASAQFSDNGSDGGQFSGGGSEAQKYLVDPFEFTRLRRGGKDIVVDAVIHQIGRTFCNGLPYLNVQFTRN